MNNRKQRKNDGSAIVEMTLLIPILLGLLYMYISLFLFMIETGRDMNYLAETLYSVEKSTQESNNTNYGNVKTYKQGSAYYITMRDVSGMFHIDLEMRRYGDFTVKNIRRWQLAIDTVRTGKDE